MDRPNGQDEAGAVAAGDDHDGGPDGDDWGYRPGADTRTRVRTIAGLLGLAVAGFVVGIALTQLLSALVFDGLGIPVTPVSIILVLLVGLQGLAFPAVALGYARYRGLSLSFFRARLPGRRDLLWALGGYVLAFLLVIVIANVLAAVQAPTAERADQELLQRPSVLLVMIPLSFLLIGPGEELLFRGVIQGTLRRVFSAPAAIVLASATFAPAHIISLQGGIGALAVSISVLFVPGLVFGYVYERTGNLVVPALSHGAYNATLFGLLYLVVTSPEMSQLLLP